MASDIIQRWKHQHSVSFVYRSYHLPMPDPSLSNADSLKLLTAWKASHSGQFTPGGYLSTVIHTTLAGIEPTTFWLLVRCATSRANNVRSRCCYIVIHCHIMKNVNSILYEISILQSLVVYYPVFLIFKCYVFCFYAASWWQKVTHSHWLLNQNSVFRIPSVTWINSN